MLYLRQVRNVALQPNVGGNEKAMRILRFMVLLLGMLGGATQPELHDECSPAARL